jgi:uncharacterized protein DUF932
MNTNPTLATRFARNTHVIRSETPLSEDQMRHAAPSVFAPGKHESRSARYTYVPTIEVLRGLRKEGFEPFMVAQGKSRIEGKTEYTKHLIRMRHAGQVSSQPEANEIILINRCYGGWKSSRLTPKALERGSANSWSAKECGNEVNPISSPWRTSGPAR